jgi:ribosomal protein L31E
MFVLSCMQVEALRRADPASKEVYQFCKKHQENETAAKIQRAVKLQINKYPHLKL